MVARKQPPECKLLVIHGLNDGNVHVGHSRRIASCFDSDGLKPVMIYLRDAGHSPHTIRDRVFIEDTLFTFFTTTLQGNCDT